MDQNKVLCSGIVYQNHALRLALPAFVMGRLFDGEAGCLIQSHSKEDYLSIIQKEQSKQGSLFLDSVELAIRHDGETMRLDAGWLLILGVSGRPSCYAAIDSLYQEAPKSFYEASQTSGYHQTEFMKHFGVEETMYAEKFMGILETMRKMEGEAQERQYERILEILTNAWPDVYRMLKNQYEVSYEFVHAIAYKDNRGPNITMVNAVRMMAVFIFLDALEIAKEDSFWFLAEYELLGLFTTAVTSSPVDLEKRIDGKIRRRQKALNKLLVYPDSFSREFYAQDRWKPERKRLDALFAIGGLSTDALESVRLSLADTERILLFCGYESEEDTARYLSDLAVVTLCRYVLRCKDLFFQYGDACQSSRKAVERERREQALLEARQARQQLAYYIKENERLAGAVAETEREYKARVRKTQGKLEKYKAGQEELTALRNFVYHLGQEDGYGLKKGKDDTADKKGMEIWKEKLKGERILVLGGRPSWQRRLKEQFPNWKYIQANQVNVKLKSMDSCRYLVINVGLMHHSFYYKVLADKQEEQRLIYAEGSNLERGIRQIAEQIYER